MFNQFTGIGRLAGDPEPRFTQSGTQVANFTVCCEHGYGDNKKTEFVRCVAWDKLAKIVCEYLHKGSMCMIQGPITTSKYTDNNGVEKYSTSINVREMKMLSPKRESSGGYNEPPGPGPESSGESVPF